MASASHDDYASCRSRVTWDLAAEHIAQCYQAFLSAGRRFRDCRGPCLPSRKGLSTGEMSSGVTAAPARVAAPRKGAFEFDLEREAKEGSNQHDEGEGDRTLDGRIDGDGLDDVGDDKDLQAEQDGAADAASCPQKYAACGSPSLRRAAAPPSAIIDPTASRTTPAISNALTTFSIHSSKCIDVQIAVWWVWDLRYGLLAPARSNCRRGSSAMPPSRVNAWGMSSAPMEALDMHITACPAQRRREHEVRTLSPGARRQPLLG